MKIKIWGCRGSLPSPSRHTLRYGGNTTCVEVRLSDGTLIVMDAGSGMRNLGKELIKDSRLSELYLLLTHSHWDHLMGFPFFLPAYSKKFYIHVRGGPIAKESVKRYLEHQMSPPYFPARLSAMKATFDFTHGIPIVKRIGTSEVIPIALNHPNGGYGYKIVEGEKVFVFLPDNELDYAHEGGKTKMDYTFFCKGADLLLHDAQFTDDEYSRATGWGHSSFISVTDLAVKAKVKRLGLFHHDPDHSDETIDRIARVCSAIAVRKSENGGIKCFGASEGQEIVL